MRERIRWLRFNHSSCLLWQCLSCGAQIFRIRDFASHLFIFTKAPPMKHPSSPNGASCMHGKQKWLQCEHPIKHVPPHVKVGTTTSCSGLLGPQTHPTKILQAEKNSLQSTLNTDMSSSLLALGPHLIIDSHSRSFSGPK